MGTEPAYSRYEALLKRLHELNRQGKLDSPEADLAPRGHGGAMVAALRG